MGRNGGLNGTAYAHLITTEVVPIVRQMFPLQNEIWQDDNARIHRTQEAIQACSVFAHRMSWLMQAPKMADCWPIENTWSLLGQNVKQREPQN